MDEGRSIAPRIVSIILFLAVIAGLVLYVLPLNNELQVINADNKVKSQELSQKKSEFKDLTDIMRNLGPNAGSEEGIKRLLAEIPANIQQEKIIEDFNKIADANSIVYNSFGFGIQEGVAENVNAITVNASFEGDYGDLQTFLKALEANTRKFVVKNIGVQMGSVVEVPIENAESGVSTVENKQNAVFTLAIEAYYQA